MPGDAKRDAPLLPIAVRCQAKNPPHLQIRRSIQVSLDRSSHAAGIACIAEPAAASMWSMPVTTDGHPAHRCAELYQVGKRSNWHFVRVSFVDCCTTFAAALPWRTAGETLDTSVCCSCCASLTRQHLPPLPLYERSSGCGSVYVAGSVFHVL